MALKQNSSTFGEGRSSLAHIFGTNPVRLDFRDDKARTTFVGAFLKLYTNWVVRSSGALGGGCELRSWFY